MSAPSPSSATSSSPPLPPLVCCCSCWNISILLYSHSLTPSSQNKTQTQSQSLPSIPTNEDTKPPLSSFPSSSSSSSSRSSLSNPIESDDHDHDHDHHSIDALSSALGLDEIDDTDAMAFSPDEFEDFPSDYDELFTEKEKKQREEKRKSLTVSSLNNKINTPHTNTNTSTSTSSPPISSPLSILPSKRCSHTEGRGSFNSNSSLSSSLTTASTYFSVPLPPLSSFQSFFSSNKCSPYLHLHVKDSSSPSSSSPSVSSPSPHSFFFGFIEKFELKQEALVAAKFFKGPVDNNNNINNSTKESIWMSFRCLSCQMDCFSTQIFPPLSSSSSPSPSFSVISHQMKRGKSLLSSKFPRYSSAFRLNLPEIIPLPQSLSPTLASSLASSSSPSLSLSSSDEIVSSILSKSLPSTHVFHSFQSFYHHQFSSLSFSSQKRIEAFISYENNKLSKKVERMKSELSFLVHSSYNEMKKENEEYNMNMEEYAVLGRLIEWCGEKEKEKEKAKFNKGKSSQLLVGEEVKKHGRRLSISFHIENHMEYVTKFLSYAKLSCSSSRPSAYNPSPSSTSSSSSPSSLSATPSHIHSVRDFTTRSLSLPSNGSDDDDENPQPPIPFSNFTSSLSFPFPIAYSSSSPNVSEGNTKNINEMNSAAPSDGYSSPPVVFLSPSDPNTKRQGQVISDSLLLPLSPSSSSPSLLPPSSSTEFSSQINRQPKLRKVESSLFQIDAEDSEDGITPSPSMRSPMLTHYDQNNSSSRRTTTDSNPNQSNNPLNGDPSPLPSPTLPSLGNPLNQEMDGELELFEPSLSSSSSLSSFDEHDNDHDRQLDEWDENDGNELSDDDIANSASLSDINGIIQRQKQNSNLSNTPSARSSISQTSSSISVNSTNNNHHHSHNPLHSIYGDSVMTISSSVPIPIPAALRVMSDKDEQKEKGKRNNNENISNNNGTPHRVSKENKEVKEKEPLRSRYILPKSNASSSSLTNQNNPTTTFAPSLPKSKVQVPSHISSSSSSSSLRSGQLAEIDSEDQLIEDILSGKLQPNGTPYESNITDEDMDERDGNGQRKRKVIPPHTLVAEPFFSFAKAKHLAEPMKSVQNSSYQRNTNHSSAQSSSSLSSSLSIQPVSITTLPLPPSSSSLSMSLKQRGMMMRSSKNTNSVSPRNAAMAKSMNSNISGNGQNVSIFPPKVSPSPSPSPLPPPSVPQRQTSNSNLTIKK